MALDEYLFGQLARYIRNRKRVAAAAQENAVHLETMRQRLTILAAAVSGAAIEIFPAEVEGGYKNNAFFLPEVCSIFPNFHQNEQFYRFRILYLSVQKKSGFNWTSASGEPSLEASRQKALETSPEVLSVLFEEFPVTQQWYEEFCQYLAAISPAQKPPEWHWLFGKWMINSPRQGAENTWQQAAPLPAPTAVHHDPQTIIKARIIEEIQQITVDQKAQEDYVLTHNFEKVETAEEFSGVWRDFDGDDELADHQDALDEVNMKFTVRTDEPVHSIYQAEFLENTTVSESADTLPSGIPLEYDEWDFVKKAYKPRFCKLYPVLLHKNDVNYYQKTLLEHTSILLGLRKMLTSVNNKLRLQRKQNQGDSFDIDSVTDLFIDLHIGHTPSENIYLSNRKKEKDLSVLLLLDISLSSDSYADGNRILDVEKQAAILFGEILSEFGIDFSVNCFHSRTRNYSTYLSLKTFEAPWNTAKYRIGAVDPGGYTRIGPALRHSCALLAARPSKNKWLILLSDGKPNDYDKYEGKYGIQDIKQALRELHEQQISTYALAIESTAKYYLPQMFGQGNYQILSTPAQLLPALVKLYEKIRQL